MTANKPEFDYSAFVGIGHNSANELSEVATLAEAQHAAETEVARLEQLLKAAQIKLQNIAENLLPARMEVLGLTTYSTTGGLHVSVSEKIRASLAVENRPKGYAWLEDNGFGGMIKTSVVAAYSRGKLEDANKLADRLRSEGNLVNVERKVEPATLTAFCKEQLAKGSELPLDIFGIFRQRIAKVEV